MVELLQIHNNERHEFCKGLKYDISAITELHNKQYKIKENELWVSAIHVDFDKQGKCKDKVVGGESRDYVLIKNETTH